MDRPTTLQKDATLYWVIRLFDPADGVTPIDADSVPTVAVRKNGSSVGDSVTVTKRAATTGIYDCSYNPASEADGDQFTLEESATISSTVYPNSFEVVVAPQVHVVTIAANAINAASISVNALDGKGNWNVGKTGYTVSGLSFQLSSSDFAANWFNASGLAADAAAEIAVAVELECFTDGTGQAFLQAIADQVASDWVAGDASPVAVAAAVRTNLATELARIDVEVSSRSSHSTTDVRTEIDAAITEIKGAGWTGTDTLEEIRDNVGGGGATVDEIWDELLAGHTTPGSAGAALASAGTAGDPWSTLLPGVYAVGTAGYIIGQQIIAALTPPFRIYSNTANVNQIQIVRGDAYDGVANPVFSFPVGKALSGQTCRFTIRDKETDAVLFTKFWTESSGTNANLSLANADTAGLTVDRHKFDVVVEWSASSHQTVGGIGDESWLEVAEDQSR